MAGSTWGVVRTRISQSSVDMGVTETDRAFVGLWMMLISSWGVSVC